MHTNEHPIYILCIETANAVTSVAIAKNDVCFALREINTSNKAADTLHKLIEELLLSCALTFNDIHAIALSSGPGSYTGLRIAAAAAKGYAFALQIPIISISTFQAMLYGIQHRYHQLAYDVYVPMIDARRMEVFTSFFNADGQLVQAYSSLIIDDEFNTLLDNTKKYIFFGNGAFKVPLANIIPTNVVYTEYTPSAADVCALAYKHYTTQQFVDIAYFEPNYTKAVYTTVSKH